MRTPCLHDPTQTSIQPPLTPRTHARHCLQDFVGLWAEYDDGSNSIDPRDLEQLLRRLPPPMGLGLHATESDIMRFVFRWVVGGCAGWVGRWMGLLVGVVERRGQVPGTSMGCMAGTGGSTL